MKKIFSLIIISTFLVFMHAQEFEMSNILKTDLENSLGVDKDKVVINITELTLKAQPKDEDLEKKKSKKNLNNEQKRKIQLPLLGAEIEVPTEQRPQAGEVVVHLHQEKKLPWNRLKQVSIDVTLDQEIISHEKLIQEKIFSHPYLGSLHKTNNLKLQMRATELITKRESQQDPKPDLSNAARKPANEGAIDKKQNQRWHEKISDREFTLFLFFASLIALLVLGAIFSRLFKGQDRQGLSQNPSTSPTQPKKDHTHRDNHINSPPPIPLESLSSYLRPEASWESVSEETLTYFTWELFQKDIDEQSILQFFSLYLPQHLKATYYHQHRNHYSLLQEIDKTRDKKSLHLRPQECAQYLFENLKCYQLYNEKNLNLITKLRSSLSLTELINTSEYAAELLDTLPITLQEHIMENLPAASRITLLNKKLDRDAFNFNSLEEKIQKLHEFEVKRVDEFLQGPKFKDSILKKLKVIRSFSEEELFFEKGILHGITSILHFIDNLEDLLRESVFTLEEWALLTSGMSENYQHSIHQALKSHYKDQYSWFVDFQKRVSTYDYLDDRRIDARSKLTRFQMNNIQVTEEDEIPKAA